MPVFLATFARRIPRPLLLALAVVAVVAACNHATPIGAKTPEPSPTTAADVGRDFVMALAETRYVSADGFLASSFPSAAPDQTVKAHWEALARQDGKFKSILDVSTAAGSASGTTDVSVRIQFAGGTDTVVVTVDPNLKVTAVTIPPGSGTNPVFLRSGSPGASPAASPSST